MKLLLCYRSWVITKPWFTYKGFEHIINIYILNQYIAILTMDLPSAQMDQIPWNANLSANSGEKFASQEILSLFEIGRFRFKMDLY